LDGGRITESVGLIIGANGSVTIIHGTLYQPTLIQWIIEYGTKPLYHFFCYRADKYFFKRTLLATALHHLVFGCTDPIIGDRPNVPLNNWRAMVLVFFSN
jgi:hypothetical protein